MQCVNLRERFGKQFRIEYDPAYDPKGRPRDKLDPWMIIIPTRVGCVIPHGETLLVAEIEGHRKVKARLNRLACCRIHQDGDDFGAFIFDMVDFAQVAAIVRPHRKAQMSEEQREKARERMLEVRAQTQSKQGVERPKPHAEVPA